MFKRIGANQNINPEYVEMVRGVNEDLLGKNEMEWTIHLDDNIDDGSARYSITLNEDERGWKTDSGYEGYGLPKELAQWICDTLNKHGKDCPYEMDKFGYWHKKYTGK